MNSRSCRRACCSRTSPACPWWLTWRRCATRSSASAAIPPKINPLQPADLVIDHSVQVDAFGTPRRSRTTPSCEFERNRSATCSCAGASSAFDNFRVVPPDTGIVHQVNLEYLAPVVFTSPDRRSAYPDTLVGTDSHTTMINGLGVVGWGVGGIEAEAAMLGQLDLDADSGGDRLSLHRRAAARRHRDRPGADGHRRCCARRAWSNKFVEFFGPGVASLSVADRATLGNMSPEYGATIGFFPVDEQTLAYLRLTGRREEHVELVEAYCKAQGLFRTADVA